MQNKMPSVKVIATVLLLLLIATSIVLASLSTKKNTYKSKAASNEALNTPADFQKVAVMSGSLPSSTSTFWVPTEPSNLELNNTFTIDTWVKINPNESVEHLVVTEAKRAESPIFDLFVSSFQNPTIDTYTARFNVKGKYQLYNLAGSTTLQKNTWYHLSAVLDKDEMRLYVNGKLDGKLNSIITDPLVLNRMTVIGGYIYNSASSNFLTGSIDEVMLSKNVRHYDDFVLPNGPYSPDSNTVFLYDMNGPNEGDTTHILDKTGKYQALISGQITFAENDIIIPATVTPPFGQGLHFENKVYSDNNMIASGRTSDLKFDPDFTVELWFKQDDRSVAWQNILFKLGSDLTLYIDSGPANSDNKLMLMSGFNNNYQVVTGPEVSLRTWHHVAVEFHKTGENVGTLSLHYDGKNYTKDNVPFKDSLYQLEIGKMYVGSLDELRLSNNLRYPQSLTTYPIPSWPFQSDTNTMVLMHLDGDVVNAMPNEFINSHINGNGVYVLSTIPAVTPTPTSVPTGSFVTASITMKPNPAKGSSPLTVKFNGAKSTSFNNILFYKWDFGDGKTSIEAKPTHVFKSKTKKKFKVTLTVSDGAPGYGHTDTATMNVNITP